MNRKFGLARCGLACCICSENGQCGGCFADNCGGAAWCEVRKCCIEKGLQYCYECNNAESCNKGLLGNLKPHTFTVFAKTYGMETLLDRLEENERNGVVYHREEFCGDYDDFNDTDALINFIKTGRNDCVK